MCIRKPDAFDWVIIGIVMGVVTMPPAIVDFAMWVAGAGESTLYILHRVMLVWVSVASVLGGAGVYLGLRKSSMRDIKWIE